MTEEVGISGFAVYVPPYRVNLESWCRWTTNVWEKTRAVVGHNPDRDPPSRRRIADRVVHQVVDQLGDSGGFAQPTTQIDQLALGAAEWVLRPFARTLSDHQTLAYLAVYPNHRTFPAQTSGFSQFS